MTTPTSNPSPVQPLHHLECGECGWTLTILANTTDPVCQCPWCGWDDLDISRVETKGAGQQIRCKTHGAMAVLIPSDNIETDDFINELYCPFCKRS